MLSSILGCILIEIGCIKWLPAVVQVYCWRKGYLLYEREGRLRYEERRSSEVDVPIKDGHNHKV